MFLNKSLKTLKDIIAKVLMVLKWRIGNITQREHLQNIHTFLMNTWFVLVEQELNLECFTSFYKSMALGNVQDSSCPPVLFRKYYRAPGSPEMGQLSRGKWPGI